MRLLAILIIYGLLLSAALARRGFRGGTRASTGGSGRAASRILIIGATGGTGRQLVAQGLERGYEVTAFARNPLKLAMTHHRLRIVAGDVLDYTSVEGAVRGQDAVLCALGSRSGFGLRRVVSEGTRNLLRAMEAHQVPRFICETSLGIGSSAGRLGLYYTIFVIPIILPFHFWDKTRQERLIAGSRVEWVIVRPGALNNRERRNAYRHGSDVGSFLWTVGISRADVADFMLHQIAGETYVGAAAGVSW